MSSLIEKLHECIGKGDLQGANFLFLDRLEDRSILDLTDGSDLESVSVFLDSILPLTIQDQPSLLINNQKLFEKYNSLLGDARTLGYSQENLQVHRQHLRCIGAIASIISGKREQILLAAEENGFDPLRLDVDIPLKNPSYEELEDFFVSFFETARKQHDQRQVREISSVLFDLLSRLKKEETVAGITRGLFIDGMTGQGEVRRVLARVELGDGSIEYATLGGEEISDSLRAASQNAWVASNSYLLDNGYSEGLHGRTVVWQITDLAVRADQLKTFYDGSSMGFPLAMAIISAYLRRPVSATVAFTGAFDIASAREGKLVRVGGVPNKSRSAIERGFKFIFLPKRNEGDIDLDLQKEAERDDFSLSFINSIAEACKEIFGNPRKKKASELFRESLNDFWGIMTFKPTKAFLRDNIFHIWGSTLLLLSVYFIEGLMVLKTSSTIPVPSVVFWSSFMLSCIVLFSAIMLSYGIVPVFLEQQRTDSWYASLIICGGASGIAYILFLQMFRGETPDFSKLFDWPVSIGILKDFLIFYAFTVLYLTNIFNNVAALDFLIRRFQVNTVRKSIESSHMIGTDIPVNLLSISWNWAVISALVAGTLLVTFEMIIYLSLKEGVEASRWYLILGVLRVFALMALAVETLIWYRNSRVAIGRKVSNV